MSFGTSFDERMETYYQRFIDLQEKLRKSEEDRLKLEMKFNEMLQISREEERSHYRRLRSQYKRFLDEDRKRQERNEKIMRALERIESRISLLSSKTERFKHLRTQYKSYFQRVNLQSQTAEPVEENYYPENSYNPVEMKSTMKKANEDKLEILEKYLKSLNSHKKVSYGLDTSKAPNYEEDLKKLDMFSKNMKDGFDSNKANSIAEEIMNSIYSRHYKKEDSNQKPKPRYNVYDDNSDYDDDHDVRSDQKQTQYDPILKTLSSDKKHVRINETDYGTQKIYHQAKSEGQDLLDNENVENGAGNVGGAQQRTKRASVAPENAYSEATSYDVLNDDKIQDINPTHLNKSEEMISQISHTENIEQVQRHNNDADNKLSCALNEELGNQSISQNLKSDANAQDDNYQKSSERSSPGNEVNQAEWSQKNEDISNQEHEASKLGDQNTQMASSEAERKDALLKGKANATEVNQEQSTGQLTEYAGQSQVAHYDIEQDTDAGKLEDNIELTQQFKTSSDNQQYDGNEQYSAQCSENTQPQQNPDQLQYDENDQHVQQYDEHGQMNQQFQEFNPNVQQYDENGQPVAPYNEDGQFLQYQEGDPSTQQYAEGQLQYNENGQLIQQHQEDDPNAGQYDEGQYNENGHLVEQNQERDTNAGQYDENGQPIAQYDENGQLIQQYQEDDPNAGQYVEGQYSENGHLVEQNQERDTNAGQYDKNGQPIGQYDENGQLIQQYQEDDPNAGQYIEGQYDENRQFVHQNQEQDTNAGQYAEAQYDENGQPIAQYDENGQLIQQYQEADPNDQQYTASQLEYDESGQPIPQYDENGQLIQQYQEGDENGEQYAASQLQYDENGQPIPQYDENGQLIPEYQERDPNGEQYAASQLQYDDNGQPIAQYDENGQLIQQYTENLIQYDENGQPIGQYPQEYDPNAQYYDENGQPVNYSETAQLYDENGQLVQQYSENNQQLGQGYQEGAVEDEEQAFGEKVNTEATPHTKEESKEFNVLELLETDTDVSVKENTSKITNDSDFDFSNA